MEVIVVKKRNVKLNVPLKQEHGVDLTGIVVIIAAILLLIAQQKIVTFWVFRKIGFNVMSKNLTWIANENKQDYELYSYIYINKYT